MFRLFLTIVSVPVLMLGLGPVAAHAQSGDVSLVGDVKLVRVVDAEGDRKESLVEPEKVVPGDRLVFSTAYRNETGQAVDNFVINNPLPGAVALAEDGDFEVSVDRGETFAPFDGQTVADGEGGRRPAELADVTHIRWTIARLEPGASGQVRYFAVVR